MERQLQKLCWQNVKELVPAKIDTLIFPVGTIEAHGSSALGTDGYIPESMALYLADKINALVAPTVNYGITKSLYGYPGSVTVTESSFKNYISDILLSFSHIGFRKIILLNGHGGNNAVLKEAAQEIFYKHKIKIAVIHWWELCRELVKEFYGEAGGHAALDETALVQAIDPDLVNKELYNRDLAYFVRPGADIYPIPGSILLYTENQGYPDFDLGKAKIFQEKIFKYVENFIKLILERWEKI
ncbi:MAG: creatininase family protein [candidate division Zixibacteria bacterium]|nr:creatininase family protein [candidate division Zixibacteria bacterium]